MCYGNGVSSPAPTRRVALLAGLVVAASLATYCSVSRMSGCGPSDGRAAGGGNDRAARKKTPPPPASVVGSSRFEAARRLDEQSARRSTGPSQPGLLLNPRRPVLPSEAATNGAALGSEGEDPFVVGGALLPSPEEALDAFESALDEMQTLADSGKRVDMKTRRRLHEQATQSFDVLTLSVDPKDPAALAQLERAYRDMRSKMDALGYDRPGTEQAPRRNRRRRRG